MVDSLSLFGACELADDPTQQLVSRVMLVRVCPTMCSPQCTRVKCAEGCSAVGAQRPGFMAQEHEAVARPLWLGSAAGAEAAGA